MRVGEELHRSSSCVQQSCESPLPSCSACPSATYSPISAPLAPQDYPNGEWRHWDPCVTAGLIRRFQLRYLHWEGSKSTAGWARHQILEYLHSLTRSGPSVFCAGWGASLWHSGPEVGQSFSKWLHSHQKAAQCCSSRKSGALVFSLMKASWYSLGAGQSYFRHGRQQTQINRKK